MQKARGAPSPTLLESEGHTSWGHRTGHCVELPGQSPDLQPALTAHALPRKRPLYPSLIAGLLAPPSVLLLALRERADHCDPILGLTSPLLGSRASCTSFRPQYLLARDQDPIQLSSPTLR